MANSNPSQIFKLPSTLPVEGSISIEIIDNQPVLRAAQGIQERIEQLLEKQTSTYLTSQEEQELNDYEELDDYLSLVNRTMRNLQQQILAS
jgi:hypothetical protein